MPGSREKSRWTRALAHASALHPWRVLAAWGAAVVGALAAVAVLLSGVLVTDGSFTAERDSRTGWQLLEDRLPDQSGGGEAVVVASLLHTIEDPEFAALAADVAADISATGQAAPVPTYWSTGEPSLVSADRRAALLPVALLDEEQWAEAIEPVVEVVQAADADPAFTVTITGMATAGRDFVAISERDLQKGELIGLPAALLVLLLVWTARSMARRCWPGSCLRSG